VTCPVSYPYTSLNPPILPAAPRSTPYVIPPPFSIPTHSYSSLPLLLFHLHFTPLSPLPPPHPSPLFITSLPYSFLSAPPPHRCYSTPLPPLSLEFPNYLPLHTSRFIFPKPLHLYRPPPPPRISLLRPTFCSLTHPHRFPPPSLLLTTKPMRLKPLLLIPHFGFSPFSIKPSPTAFTAGRSGAGSRSGGVGAGWRPETSWCSGVFRGFTPGLLRVLDRAAPGKKLRQHVRRSDLRPLGRLKTRAGLILNRRHSIFKLAGGAAASNFFRAKAAALDPLGLAVLFNTARGAAVDPPHPVDPLHAQSPNGASSKTFFCFPPPHDLRFQRCDARPKLVNDSDLALSLAIADAHLKTLPFWGP